MISLIKNIGDGIYLQKTSVSDNDIVGSTYIHDTAYVGRGSVVECGEGLSGLCQTAQYGYLLQISGAGIDSGG